MLPAATSYREVLRISEAPGSVRQVSVSDGFPQRGACCRDLRDILQASEAGKGCSSAPIGNLIENMKSICPCGIPMLFFGQFGPLLESQAIGCSREPALFCIFLMIRGSFDSRRQRGRLCTSIFLTFGWETTRRFVVSGGKWIGSLFSLILCYSPWFLDEVMLSRPHLGTDTENGEKIVQRGCLLTMQTTW